MAPDTTATDLIENGSAKYATWQVVLGVGVFDPVRRVLNTATDSVRLSPQESDALFILLRHSPDPIRLTALAGELSGSASLASDTACRQVIRSLRKKLGAAGLGVAIATWTGVGYILIATDGLPCVVSERSRDGESLRPRTQPVTKLSHVCEKPAL